MLHAAVRRASTEKGVSLNEYCSMAIESFTNAGDADLHRSGAQGERWVADAEGVVGDALVGVVLFGSQARGEATPSSDTDLLVVVADDVELNRELYHHWDSAEVDRQVNPHFVHLPEGVAEAGSIWFEVALDGIVISEDGRRVSAFLQTVRRAIADGLLQRRYVHGHPYWVKNLEAANAE
jgi:predicted nucleotidyltransferase